MRNNKKELARRNLTLLSCMVFAVFGILLISMLIGIAGVSLLLKQGSLTLDAPFLPGSMVLYLLLISLVVGTILSLVAGRITLRPLKKFIETTEQVASGDFSVRFKSGKLVESNQLIQSLNTMIEELGSIETLRDDFVRNISHEFKTPVASIHGFAELLKKGNLSEEERQEYLDIILSESERLSKLSKNVLLLSKLDTLSCLSDREEYNLDEQLRRSILVLNNALDAKGIELDIQLESCYVVANEELFEQVWLNLIGNAIKFTPQGGIIGIELKKQGTSATVTIRDNGVGMEPEVMQHIFDKFYQKDTSRACEGNGLGLALVKKIVELNNGSIYVQSEVGVGSKFSVNIPLGKSKLHITPEVNHTA